MSESEKLYEFKKLLRKLRIFSGSGTELISLYVAKGAPIHDSSAKLREELGQASNIKSKSTKTNVMGALERMIGYLKMFKSTPPNGLAVFCGNTSENSAKIEMEVFSVEPPFELNVSAYRCDNKFFLEPLEDMIETKDAYGLVVMDGREATIAILRGKNTEILKKLVSMAHAKVNKGGQCLDSGTFVQTISGDIREISKLNANEKIKALNLKTNKIDNFVCSDIFKTNSKSFHIIKTNAPGTEIKATPYHRFLVISEHGIKEKYAKDLNEKDKLLFARKIRHDGIKIKLNATNANKGSNICYFPDYYNYDFAYFLGVMCGDGTLDGNRLIIYEGKKNLADEYCKKFEQLFKIKPVLREVDKTKQKGSFAKNKYYEIRLYSLQIVNTISSECPEVVAETRLRDIPRVVLESENEVLAGFLKGLYDAEGYLDNTIVRIAGTAKKLMQKCSIALFRFGIISSFHQKPVKGNPQWQVTISDSQSLFNFKEFIGFTRTDKKERLEQICKTIKKSQQYADQIPIHGRQVYNLIKEAGLSSRDFGAGDFFLNKKSMGRNSFKELINKIENKIDKKWIWIVDLLKQIHDGDVTLAKISQNINIEESGQFYDLTVPEAANFIANGLIVHNSQRRYQRLVEESIEYYHKRIGEYMNECFLGKVKGIVVGGPGPAKDSFMKLKPFNYQLKILGVVDTGYTDEYGIREVLSKSEDLIAEQEAIREKQVIDNFIKEISKNGLATYGYKNVKEAITIRQADNVLLSEELQGTVYLYKCNSCSEADDVISLEKQPERIPCTKCIGELRVEKSVLVLDYIIDLSRENNIDVEMISDKTAEGSQFLAGFTGIGAFLRYKK